MSNILIRTVIMEVKSSSVFLFLLFELDKDKRLDFFFKFEICFSFLFGAANQANLIIKVIY